MKKQSIVRMVIISMMLMMVSPVTIKGIVPKMQNGYTVEAKKKLTKKQAKKKLISYLKKRKRYKKKYILECEGMEGNKYVFHYFEMMKTHTATYGWYYVNRNTGKITSII